MTAPSRKEIARAFELAAQRIQIGRTKYFICCALNSQYSAAADAAKAIIMERLAPCDSYGAWLELNAPEARKAYCNSTTAFREARLCWLAALIEEFSV